MYFETIHFFLRLHDLASSFRLLKCDARSDPSRCGSSSSGSQPRASLPGRALDVSRSRHTWKL